MLFSIRVGMGSAPAAVMVTLGIGSPQVLLGHGLRNCMFIDMFNMLINTTVTTGKTTITYIYIYI